MFSRTNIEQELQSLREKRISSEEILEEVYSLLEEQKKPPKPIKKTEVYGLELTSFANAYDFSLLESERIYHISDIKKLCTVYRLRFLDAHRFSGKLPEEAVSKIQVLEKQHRTNLKDFKIMAPAKLMKLDNADDPLLFGNLGYDYYYLIHKWGKDLDPFRKWTMWPFQKIENLTICLIFITAFFTAILPIHWFTPNPGTAEYIFLFLFNFKALVGLTFFYAIKKGKNFSNTVWNSPFYNG